MPAPERLGWDVMGATHRIKANAQRGRVMQRRTKNAAPGAGARQALKLPECRKGLIVVRRRRDLRDHVADDAVGVDDERGP